MDVSEWDVGLLRSSCCHYNATATHITRTVLPVTRYPCVEGRGVGCLVVTGTTGRTSCGDGSGTEPPSLEGDAWPALWCLLTLHRPSIYSPHNATAHCAAHATVPPTLALVRKSLLQWCCASARGYWLVAVHAEVIYAVTGGLRRQRRASVSWRVARGDMQSLTVTVLVSVGVDIFALSIIPLLTTPLHDPRFWWRGRDGVSFIQCLHTGRRAFPRPPAPRRVPDVSREAPDEVWLPCCTVLLRYELKDHVCPLLPERALQDNVSPRFSGRCQTCRLHTCSWTRRSFLQTLAMCCNSLLLGAVYFSSLGFLVGGGDLVWLVKAAERYFPSTWMSQLCT